MKVFHFKTKSDYEGIFACISKRKSLKIIKISLKHFIILYKYIEFEKKLEKPMFENKARNFCQKLRG
jgi:hypothetical protein